MKAVRAATAAQTAHCLLATTQTRRKRQGGEKKVEKRTQTMSARIHLRATDSHGSKVETCYSSRGGMMERPRPITKLSDLAFSWQ